MSATINHEIFMKYYDDAPLLSIPGFAHPVVDKWVHVRFQPYSRINNEHVRYLEEIIPQIKYQAPSSRSQKNDSQEQKLAQRDQLAAQGLDATSIALIQNITRSNQIDYQVR